MIQEVHLELEKHVAVSVHSCQHKFAGAVSLSVVSNFLRFSEVSAEGTDKQHHQDDTIRMKSYTPRHQFCIREKR